MKLTKELIVASMLSCLVACSNEVNSPDLSGEPVVTIDDVAEANTPLAEIPSQTRFDLPMVFDCLRENKGVAIAAHRGGPYPGYPENAIETMQYLFDNGVRVFEVDVAESRDGVLFLMHDNTLTRTTTGRGDVSDTLWADIKAMKLVDNDGKTTRFRAPTLREALDWAVEVGAIVELDKKRTTSFRNIMDQVRAASAESNSILISYNDDQAAQIARVAPDMMLTASAYGDRNIAKLVDLGVDQDNLIAWTGVGEVKPDAWARVNREGVEAAFGTLGRPGERLDDLFLADGDGSEFQLLVDQGVVLLATDAPLEAAEAIDGDEIAANKCGL